MCMCMCMCTYIVNNMCMCMYTNTKGNATFSTSVLRLSLPPMRTVTRTRRSLSLRPAVIAYSNPTPMPTFVCTWTRGDVKGGEWVVIRTNHHKPWQLPFVKAFSHIKSVPTTDTLRARESLYAYAHTLGLNCPMGRCCCHLAVNSKTVPDRVCGRREGCIFLHLPM